MDKLQSTGKPADKRTDKRADRPQAQELERVRSLARLLDNAVRVPGTDYRVGLDPLLGLVPAAGDYIGAILSGYILLQATRFGVSRQTLGRMGANIVLEMLVGIVPVAGDLFDVAWKANARNLELLESAVADPKQRQRSDWLFFAAIVGAIAIVLVTLTALGIWLLSAGFGVLSGS